MIKWNRLILKIVFHFHEKKDNCLSLTKKYTTINIFNIVIK